MRTQQFGIEIELTGITRSAAANIIKQQCWAVTKTHVGGSYDAYHITDTKNRTWKIVSDSSVQAQKKASGHISFASTEYRVELVSPILTYEDIEPLQELIRDLRRVGGLTSTALLQRER